MVFNLCPIHQPSFQECHEICPLRSCSFVSSVAVASIFSTFAIVSCPTPAILASSFLVSTLSEIRQPCPPLQVRPYFVQNSAQCFLCRFVFPVFPLPLHRVSLYSRQHTLFSFFLYCIGALMRKFAHKKKFALCI